MSEPENTNSGESQSQTSLPRKKDDLFDYAKEKYGVELDLTRKHADLVAEVQALETGTGVADADPEPEQESAPRRLRHKVTGQEVPYNPIFAKNQDLEVIEG